MMQRSPYTHENLYTKITLLENWLKLAEKNIKQNKIDDVRLYVNESKITLSQIKELTNRLNNTLNKILKGVT